MNGAVVLEKTVAALETLINAGSCFQGMFPSFMTLDSFKPCYGLPQKLTTHRGCDRAAFGSNLMHDHITLRLCYELARILDKPELADGADAYLRSFTARCTRTVTGLFTWGEHAYWDIVHDAPGNSWTYTEWGPRKHPLHHDHLRQAPEWLWAKLWDFDSVAVLRFCEGLDNHWERDRPDGRVTFNRHAYIEKWESYVSTSATADFGFPRHAGFYIYDWAFAYARTARPDLRARIVRMLAHHWAQRNAAGLLPMHGRWNVRQTLSLGVSLMEAAALVEPVDAPLADDLRRCAAVYLEGFLGAQDELKDGRLVMDLPMGPERPKVAMPGALDAIAGEGGGGATALLCCQAYRLTGQRAFLDAATALARACSSLAAAPVESVCPREAGMLLALFTDLADLTGDRDRWAPAAAAVTDTALARVFDRLLPRAHSRVDFYESQTVPGRLLYSLARAALVFNGDGRAAPPEDYTQR